MGQSTYGCWSFLTISITDLSQYDFFRLVLFPADNSPINFLKTTLWHSAFPDNYLRYYKQMVKKNETPLLLLWVKFLYIIFFHNIFVMLLFFKCFLLFLSSIVTFFMKNASTETGTKKMNCFGHYCFFCVYVYRFLVLSWF